VVFVPSSSVGRKVNRAQGRVRRKTRTTVETKRDLLGFLREGLTVREACKLVGKDVSTHSYYRANDEAYKAEADFIKSGVVVEVDSKVPDFPEFCADWLNMPLFPHQLQWFDVLEGREPRGLHPAQSYLQSDPNLVVVNTPPGHAKSTTITIAYCTWLIVKNPSIRIVLVSQAQKLAIQFLHAIKTRLTGPGYKRLQEQFGPPGGYDADSASWKQDLIYVSSNIRMDGEKDPTVQAIGIGGQLYGSRADLIILDDVVVNANAGDYEKQIHWLQTEVLSRIPDEGKVLVVGTRMAPRDMYGELLDAGRYHSDDKSPWTYLAQPAVLEFAESPDDWVTLWPKASEPASKGVKADGEGLFPKWTGPVLAKRRGQITPAQWARVYQQEQVAEDTVFKIEDIRACVKGWSPGVIPNDPAGRVGRPGGLEGLRIVAGLDPASVGHTACVVVGFEPGSNTRFILDAHNEPGMTPDALRQLIRDMTVKYGVSEWRIERNAFQRFLTLDSEVRQFLASHGSILTEHTTGRNKNDSSFGVMAMEGLFTSRLVALPRLQTEPIKALVEQLTTWSASAPKAQKDDLVMALWFAELRCLELVRATSVNESFHNGARDFMSRADIRSRRVVSSLDSEFGNAGATSWGG